IISSAPSLIALSAARRAPSGVPLVSLGMSETLGLSKSNRASSAACFSAFATAGVEPGEVTGRRSATFTAPVELVKPAPPGPPPPPPGAPHEATSIATPIAASTSFTAAKWRPMQNANRIVFLLVGDLLKTTSSSGWVLRPQAAYCREELVRNDGPIVMDEARPSHVTFERLGRPVID